MATKNGIGYSPLSDKVYLGKQNKEKRIWTGEKEDITNQFLDVAFAYFEENTIRNIGSSNGKENLFINVKKDGNESKRSFTLPKYSKIYKIKKLQSL